MMERVNNVGRTKLHPSIRISSRDKASVYKDNEVVLFRVTDEEADEYAYQLSGELWEIELIPQQPRPAVLKFKEED